MEQNAFGKSESLRSQAEKDQKSLTLSELGQKVMEWKIESEKSQLGKNSQEVLELIAEKDPGTLTEKAKLLLIRIKNITTLKVDALDVTAFLAFAGFTIAFAFSNPSIPPEYKDVVSGALTIAAAGCLLGVASIKKYNEALEKLYAKVKPA